MGREMALGQDQYSSCPLGLKLVKSSGYDNKPALFSDSIHYGLEVARRGDPDPLDVSYQVFH